MDGGLKFRNTCLHHHHHHLICTHCEKTLTFDYCPMEAPIQFPGHFKITNHRFEVYGICEDCQHRLTIDITLMGRRDQPVLFT